MRNATWLHAAACGRLTMFAAVLFASVFPAVAQENKAVLVRLADEPGALAKRPDYVVAAKTLAEELKQVPDYVDAMKAVHAKFKGTPGTFAQIGDSITADNAFWTPLQNGGKNMSPQMKRDSELIKGYIKPECWGRKGRKYGNEGGMSSPWGSENIETWLREMNPETVVLLFGSNDMDRKGAAEQNLKEYEQAMRQICAKCLENGTVVILTTVPPRGNRRCDIYAEKVIAIASDLKLPVCDFLGEVIRRRPDDWNGAMDKFWEDPSKRKAKEFKNEVHTLISGDGEHPSHPKDLADDYSEEALKNSGYNLRTYLTATIYADVIRRVFGVGQKATN